MAQKVSLFWFRRDLRLEDNKGLYEALNGVHKVLPIFIFDTEILDRLPPNDARLTFIFDTLQALRSLLGERYSSAMGLYHGAPTTVFKALLRSFDIQKVYANHDYEPYALERDTAVKQLLASEGIPFATFKDQVIFEKNEIVKPDGKPYVVYTPYKNRWKAKFKAIDHGLQPTKPDFANFIHTTDLPQVTLSDLGFERSAIRVQPYQLSPALIERYEASRNYPAHKDGTSRLGPHLRFGTVSIRMVLEMALAQENEVFWNELIWREFFMQILWHFPHTVTRSFRPKYDRIAWRNNRVEFEAWKKGETGYPLVDAGMRELNNTGYMHNRVRMLVASFLCKHLLVDWRWGEAYFAEKLLDYDLSANIGNWQWAAGSGVDAAPYFRIFNPTTQIEKFDAQHTYINTWVPELGELTYPTPIVDHKLARERCLKVYKEAVA